MSRARRSTFRAALAATLAMSIAMPAGAADRKACLTAVAKGQALRDESKLLDARQQFLVCSASSCPGPVRADCALWLSDVERAMPTVVPRATDAKRVDLADTVLRVDGAIVTLRLDGRPLPLDPGAHVLRFEHRGYKPAEERVVIKTGERERVISATLERSAEEPPGPPPPPAAAGAVASSSSPEGSAASERSVPLGSWIGWGVGAAGLIGFGVLGLKANLDYSSLKDSCGERCTTTDRDSLQTTMTVADIFLVVGLVGAGVGTVLYLLQPGASPPSHLSGRAQ